MVERDRWPLWFPVLLGLGIGLYFSLPFEPPLWFGWLFGGILGFWALRLHNRPIVAAGVLALALVLLGLGVAGLRTWWVAAPVINAESGALSLSAQVERIEVLDHGQRVSLIHLHSARLSPDATPKSVRIKLMGEQPPFLPGDWIELRANLMPPPAPAMPGAFDFQRQSYFRGLGGVGFAFGKIKVIGAAPNAGLDSLSFGFQRLRTAITQRVRDGFGVAQSGDRGAIAMALMTGERSEISEPVLNDMRASGLAHLLAISGLHVGLIAGIVFFALRAGLALIPWLALRYPIKKWAAALAILAAFAYALLAGATVPTQRAFLMVAIVLLAVVFDRRAVSMRLVAWAAMAILVLSPESLLGASFQMSFSAVVALVGVYEVLSRRGVLQHSAETKWGQVGRYMMGVALTTAVAGAATGFFAAYHFNRVADFGLAANLIAVPVTALWIMPWAVVAYALMPLGLESLALTPMGWGIDVLMRTAHTVAGWPGAVSDVAAFPTWGLVLIALGGLWLALWQGRWRLGGIPVFAIGLLSLFAESMPDVIIHADAKLAAVRTPQGHYAFSSLKTAKFERDVWLRRAGLAGDMGRWTEFAKESENEQGPSGGVPKAAALRCDALGCLYQAKGQRIAFTRVPEALQEDCWAADVVVVNMPEATCPAVNLLITSTDLKRLGTHAVWLSTGSRDPTGAKGIRVKTVNGERGDRPWVLKPKR
ncbi:hypothetical protein BEN30_06925 [Magnetovibrio blakemorei]|uniref:ComEC/Rec2-related protein domain-containing protein n=2 Tax=Magnetovibrio blakemorei TaxID=28181 RepID=A0A1E5Q917_9PROT|nr:hypothetical protein BEN30_06925 [Magnetovibrio blakemorei]